MIRPVIETTVNEQHYSIPAAARRLGIHPATIRRALDRGEMSAFDAASPDSTNRHLRIPESVLDNWYRARFLPARVTQDAS